MNFIRNLIDKTLFDNVNNKKFQYFTFLNGADGFLDLLTLLVTSCLLINFICPYAMKKLKPFQHLEILLFFCNSLLFCGTITGTIFVFLITNGGKFMLNCHIDYDEMFESGKRSFTTKLANNSEDLYAALNHDLNDDIAGSIEGKTFFNTALLFLCYFQMLNKMIGFIPHLVLILMKQVERVNVYTQIYCWFKILSSYIILIWYNGRAFIFIALVDLFGDFFVYMKLILNKNFQFQYKAGLTKLMWNVKTIQFILVASYVTYYTIYDCQVSLIVKILFLMHSVLGLLYNYHFYYKNLFNAMEKKVN